MVPAPNILTRQNADLELKARLDTPEKWKSISSLRRPQAIKAIKTNWSHQQIHCLHCSSSWPLTEIGKTLKYSAV